MSPAYTELWSTVANYGVAASTFSPMRDRKNRRGATDMEKLAWQPQLDHTILLWTIHELTVNQPQTRLPSDYGFNETKLGRYIIFS